MQSQLTRLPASVPVAILQVPTDEARIAFCALLLPLVQICKPPLTDGQVDTYFGLLHDLPALAIQGAAVAIASGRIYPAWPMPGEIRAKALELTQKERKVGHGEAFKLASMAAARMIDEGSYDLDGYTVIRGGKGYTGREWNQKIMDGLPPTVAYAMRCFGVRRFAVNDTNTFAQWRDHYNGIAAREKSQAELPGIIHDVVKKFAAWLPAIEEDRPCPKCKTPTPKSELKRGFCPTCCHGLDRIRS